MDGFYRGLETFLLALGFALGVMIAATARPAAPEATITLATIEVVADTR